MGLKSTKCTCPSLLKRSSFKNLSLFPPLDTGRSFYMPLSAPRGLLSQLQQVPFFRIPKTLGWPFLDSPMPPFSPPPISLQPLLDLLGVLPFFLPPRIRCLLPMETMSQVCKITSLKPMPSSPLLVPHSSSALLTLSSLVMDTSPPYSSPLSGASPRVTLLSASRASLAPARLSPCDYPLHRAWPPYPHLL